MLRDYQEQAQRFLLDHRRCIYGDAAGSGKTPTTLAALRAAQVRRVLLVVPRSVCLHWQREAEIWFPELHLIDGRGTVEKRARAREQAVALSGEVGSSSGATGLLLNYDLLRMDVVALERLGWQAVVFDEAHRLKNRKAQVTKAAQRITRRLPGSWLWMLSGTPILNHPSEAWSLLHLISHTRWPSYWNWVRRFCETSLIPYHGRQRQPVEVIGALKPGAAEAIKDQLDDVLIQRDLDTLLPHLPQVTEVPVPVQLDPHEEKAYREIKRKHWTVLDDGTLITTQNEISRITRFRQIVGEMGALASSPSKPGAKVRAVAEIVADLEPEPVVVLCWSRAAAERIAEMTLGEFVHGGLDSHERDAVVRHFADGKVRVIVGTIATLGEGVDGLQRARYMVRLDRDWTPARNEQAVARIRRSGQLADTLVVYDVFATNTVDEEIARVVADKRSVIDAVLTGEIRP